MLQLLLKNKITMKVQWTKKAINENEKIVEYLLDNWNVTVVTNYLKKLDSLIIIIKTNPSIGLYDSEINAHRIVLVKQVTIFYRLVNNEIHIMSFWNNHKKPYWL